LVKRLSKNENIKNRFAGIHTSDKEGHIAKNDSCMFDCRLQSLRELAFDFVQVARKMPRTPRRRKEHEDREEIAETIKQRLVLLILFLIALLLALIFGVGEPLWPVWMVEYRSRIAAILLLVIICSILLSPIMIEATSNTRTLSGPGKNPKGPNIE